MMKRHARRRLSMCQCLQGCKLWKRRSRQTARTCDQLGPSVVISPARDMSSADSVHGLIRRASAAMDECPESLIIDCRDVEQADSAFAASLILLTRIAHHRTISVRIQGIVGRPLALLQVLGVATVLSTLGVVADATSAV